MDAKYEAVKRVLAMPSNQFIQSEYDDLMTQAKKLDQEIQQITKDEQNAWDRYYNCVGHVDNLQCKPGDDPVVFSSLMDEYVQRERLARTNAQNHTFVLNHKQARLEFIKSQLVNLLVQIDPLRNLYEG